MRDGLRYFGLLFVAMVATACMPVSAQAAFGLEDFDVRFSATDGSAVAQAGSHPFAMTVSLTVNSSGGETEGRLRELFIDLPPGLVVDPFAVPRCPTSVFLDPGDDCPLATTVGVSSASLDPGVFEDSRIYNLPPPAGVPLRLGFALAGSDVVADIGVSPNPPHNPIAVVGDWPEAVDVFAADLELWGVPAETAHNAARGGPVAGAVHPFLTLPAGCQGPQATFYEAVSWEGEEESGSAVTHDDATPPNPMGFSGCGKLSFGPAFAAQLTTEEAKSHTGFEFSLDFFDEGLANPAGIAQSQVRDLVLVLPEGLALDSAVVSGLERCSDAEFEAAGEVGGGCPDDSQVGTVAIESPLLAGPVAGKIFAAEPLGGEGVEALDLFVVVEEPQLGLVVKQIVELEPDPETGELVAFAEDLPMLPFSDLHGVLPGGPESLLVTPPLCGAYDGHDAEHEPIRALLNPWSGSQAHLTTARFEIVAGPNGGPCPEPGEGEPKGPLVTPPLQNLSPPGPSFLNVAPSTSLKSTKVVEHEVTFKFSSNEAGATFLCKLDKKAFARCGSPKTYKNLKPGEHKFQVKSRDQQGALDSSPAVRIFRIKE